MQKIKTLELLKEARKAAKQAYAPYSGYRVGAVILAGDGRIFSGCNVENNSYGLTMCAERVAVASAIAAGANKFKAIAVVAYGKKLPSPCGACRQVLIEFCRTAMPVYFASAANLRKFRKFTLSQLLPAAYGSRL